MGWEAVGGSWTGGQPGRDHGLSGPTGPAAGFEHGGPWETAVPSTPTGRTYVQKPWRYTG